MTAGGAGPASGGALLMDGDPCPVELLNPDSDFPVVLFCEHAGQAVPGRLGDLGITQAQLDAHIGWDIGAGAVTRHMAECLGAPAILQRYSRLVIDCNRPPHAPDSVPEVSDGVAVPANRRIGAAERQARIDEVFVPFHAAANALLDGRQRRAAVSVHSFTPVFGGVGRPWDLGFLFRRDSETSAVLRDHVRQVRPELKIGMNEPYQIDDISDWFVPRHGEARGLPHSLIEIRNDRIATPADQKGWAGLLCGAILQFLKGC